MDESFDTINADLAKAPVRFLKLIDGSYIPYPMIGSVSSRTDWRDPAGPRHIVYDARGEVVGQCTPDSLAEFEGEPDSLADFVDEPDSQAAPVVMAAPGWRAVPAPDYDGDDGDDGDDDDVGLEHRLEPVLAWQFQPGHALARPLCPHLYDGLYLLVAPDGRVFGADGIWSSLEAAEADLRVRRTEARLARLERAALAATTPKTRRQRRKRLFRTALTAAAEDEDAAP